MFDVCDVCECLKEMGFELDKNKSWFQLHINIPHSWHFVLLVPAG